MQVNGSLIAVIFLVSSMVYSPVFGISQGQDGGEGRQSGSFLSTSFQTDIEGEGEGFVDEEITADDQPTQTSGDSSNVGTQTLECDPNGPVLSRASGSQGPDVVNLQNLLIQIGYDPGPVDGVYGKLTEGAVLAFQLDNGLTSDGVVGPNTWMILCQGFGSVSSDVVDNISNNGLSDSVPSTETPDDANTIEGFGDNNVVMQENITGGFDDGGFGSETIDDGSTGGVGSDTLITYPDGTTCDPAITSCPVISYPDGTSCDPNTTSCTPSHTSVDGGFSTLTPGFDAENTSLSERPEGGFGDEPVSDLDVGTDPAALAQESASQLTLACDPNSNTLSNGDQGTLVGNLQSILLALGYHLPNFGADNDFGAETENAVMLFQNDNPPLENDGVVGSLTWNKLCEVYNTELVGLGDDGSPVPTTPPEAPPAVGPGYTICSSPQSLNLAEFIKNPEASSLDYLDYDKCIKFRTTQWSHNDFPGNGGPSSGLARDIRKSLSDPQIFPERRANTNTYPGKTENTALYLGRDIENENDADWRYIESQLSNIPGGKKLNKYAAESFNQMKAAALSDGVELNIASAWRPLSSTRGGECTNPSAKACGSTALSSHNIGLAGDFRLPGYGIKTRPFQDVVDMRQTPEHKWLIVHGPEYGWYPYNNEPWHFEYNPPGVRDTLFAER